MAYAMLIVSLTWMLDTER